MIEPKTGGQAADARDLPMLSLTEKIILLKGVPAFKDIPAEQMKEMAATCQVEHHPNDGIIFYDGERSEKLYVVIKGKVVIEKESLEGPNITLVELGARKYFGEMGLFDGSPRSAAARASGDTYLLSLTKEALFQLGYRFPQIFVEIIHVLSQRLRDLNKDFVR